MRKTKLTEAEQQWYKKEAESGKGKWNSIKFDGSMTIEEYQQELEKERQLEEKYGN